MVTEAQRLEFLARRAKGPQLSQKEVEEFNKDGVKLTQEQYEAFLKITDEKTND